jgi:hypothetical protein
MSPTFPQAVSLPTLRSELFLLPLAMGQKSKSCCAWLERWFNQTAFQRNSSTFSQTCLAVILISELVEKEWEMANPLTVIKSLGAGKGEVKGVVKRDWVPTGRIDFASKLDSNDDPNQPSEFKLLVEERRIIESVAGNEHLEIQWRLATLKEAKVVAAQYLKYLTENSLIKSVNDPEIFPPEPKHKDA